MAVSGSPGAAGAAGVKKPEPTRAAEEFARQAATRHALEQITGALNRFAEGTYDRCEKCDDSIPAERLEVLPHARFWDVLAVSSRQRIADTARALRRMPEGTYGLCEDCHQLIPLGRLRAFPCIINCALCERRRPEGLMNEG